MYTASHRCYVVPEGFDELAEGRARPGHFRGVATIVTKLFGIVQPTKVRKDGEREKERKKERHNISNTPRHTHTYPHRHILVRRTPCSVY